MTSPRTQLIHNPGAGFTDYSRKQMLNIFAEENWEVSYMSTKAEWHIHDSTEMVIIAGGDGTVRKVVGKIACWPQKPILGILPIGTANNIARSLGIGSNIRETLKSWRNNQYSTKAYDLGMIEQPVNGEFFLESVGVGIFPHLMKAMEYKKHTKPKTVEESIKNSLVTLHETGLVYEPHYACIELDKEIYSGLFLWIEIMNMNLMGPGLTIVPAADSNDQILDVIMVREDDRDKINSYFESSLTSNPLPFPIPSIKTDKLKLQWYGSRVHVDDDLQNFPSSGEMCIAVKSQALQFLLP